MKFKTFAPVLLAIGLSTAAKAANAPLKLPTVNGYAVTMPGIGYLPMSMPGATTVMAEIAVPALQAASYPISAPISLPTLPAPAIGRATLPGVPSPLPLPLPIALAEAARPAHSSEEPPLPPAGEIFDGRREAGREIALPHAKFF